LADAADRPVKTYSGGMQRRLDLAAALVHRPPVLFLERAVHRRRRPLPGGPVDGHAGLVAEGSTLLLTTQYLEEADRLTDRIAVVDHGRVIAEGTAAQLKERMGADHHGHPGRRRRPRQRQWRAGRLSDRWRWATTAERSS
jgi:ABC-2 type transport system ATP-binding protein